MLSHFFLFFFFFFFNRSCKTWIITMVSYFYALNSDKFEMSTILLKWKSKTILRNRMLCLRKFDRMTKVSSVRSAQWKIHFGRKFHGRDRIPKKRKPPVATMAVVRRKPSRKSIARRRLDVRVRQVLPSIVGGGKLGVVCFQGVVGSVGGGGGGGGGARSELAMPGRRSISLRCARRFRTHRYHPAARSTSSPRFATFVTRPTAPPALGFSTPYATPRALLGRDRKKKKKWKT